MVLVFNSMIMTQFQIQYFQNLNICKYPFEQELKMKITNNILNKSIIKQIIIAESLNELSQLKKKNKTKSFKLGFQYKIMHLSQLKMKPIWDKNFEKNKNKKNQGRNIKHAQILINTINIHLVAFTLK